MKQTLLYLWQLPQNLLGLALLAIYGFVYSLDFNDAGVFLSERMQGAISLGHYVIVRKGQATPTTLMHEWGHCRQSLYLGPLYLVVIGLPSILHAWWWNKERGASYYAFFTERWADRLGGVKRENS